MVRGRVTTSPGLYPSWQAGLVEIYKKGGMRGLFEGVNYSNAWALVYYGVQFFSYDSLKRMYMDHRRANGKEGPISPAMGLGFGAVSGSFCVTAAYPLELIRRKLQVQGFGGRPIKYKGWFDCYKQVIANEGGFRGLFRGLGANMVKTPPSIALTFGAYELLMKHAFRVNPKA
jgi:solute carrier family 25 phosphate transporter 23/24/25/41